VLKLVEPYQRYTPYIFLLPIILLFSIFWAIPVAEAFYYSFTRFNALTPPKFVGIENYILALKDPLFYHSLLITFEFAFLSQLITMIIGLSLALAANSGLRGKGIFRIVYFLPVVTSSVAISLMWAYMFDPIYGVLNSFIKLFGFAPQPWIFSSKEALLSIIVMTVWQWAGYHMFIFLSGLQAIPDEYYKAAVIDSAGPIKRFFKITLPLLKPTILFVFVLATIGGLQIFTPIYIMTSGGPNYSTYTLMYYIYQQAFHFLKFGYADAVAVLFLAVTGAIIGVEAIWLRKGGLTYYGQKA
jgi:multiple sugar transport system permease protein